jgi:hypothetical protein
LHQTPNWDSIVPANLFLTYLQVAYEVQQQASKILLQQLINNVIVMQSADSSGTLIGTQRCSL